MKHIFLIMLCALPLLNRSQTYSWAQSGNSAGGYCEGMGIATDASANVFIVGQYTGPNIIFGTYTLTNTGINGDAYLVKYNSSGTIQWAGTLGGAFDDIANAVATDASGNVFVTGNFTSPTMVIGTTTLTNSGPANDLFLAKYDANGNVLWATSAGGASVENSFGVSTDAAGNAYITGSFSSSSLAIGSTTLTNPGGNDAIFVAKYNASGSPQWALMAGGSSDYGLAIATDNTGNTFVTGTFASPTLTFGTYTITRSGLGSVFLTKFDSNGNALWAKASSGSSYGEGYGVTTDASGASYITGDFTGPKIVFGTYTVTNPGGGTMFVAKFDASGNPLWMKGAGGAGGHIGYSVSSYTGGVYVTGGVTATVSVFGAYTLSAPTTSVDPMFIVKYDLNGNALCADIVSSGGDDQSGVSVDQSGNAYITGDFLTNPFVLGTTSLTPVGTEDVFVTKFSCVYNLGIEVLNKKEDSPVYPNPNNGSFNLIINNELDKAELILFNSLGQKIHEQNIMQGINTINIGACKGIYNYIILQNKQKLSDGKVVVE